MIAIIPLFIASLLGSLHCAAMCGGFVAFYSADSGSRWSSHLSYNLGRLLTYLLLGSAAFFLGTRIDLLGERFGVSKLSALLVAIVLISFGIGALLRIKFKNLGAKWLERFGAGRCLAQVMRGSARPSLKAFLIGTLSTTLPCGWLYSFVAIAATANSLAEACIVMLVFWLGTLPVMFTFGTIAARLGQRLGRVAPYLTALLILCAGLSSLYQHLNAPLQCH